MTPPSPEAVAAAVEQVRLFPIWLRMQFPATAGNIHVQHMEEHFETILAAEREKDREMITQLTGALRLARCFINGDSPTSRVYDTIDKALEQVTTLLK